MGKSITFQNTVLTGCLGIRKPMTDNTPTAQLSKRGVDGYYKVRRLILDIASLLGTQTFNPFTLIERIGFDVGVVERYSSTVSEKCLRGDLTLEDLVREFGNMDEGAQFYLKNPRKAYYYGVDSYVHVTAKVINTCETITKIMTNLEKLYGSGLFSMEVIADSINLCKQEQGWITPVLIIPNTIAQEQEK